MDLKGIKNIIIFIISMKISINFKGKWKTVKYISLILLILFALLNSMNFNDIINILLNRGYNPERILFYLNLGIMIVIMGRGLFPFYREVENVIPIMAPLPYSYKALFNFIYDICSPLMIYIVFFLSGLLFINPYYHISSFALTISVFVSAAIFNNLFRRIISTYEEIKLNGNFAIIIGIFVSFLLFLGAFTVYNKSIFFYFNITFTALLFVLFAVSSKFITNNKNKPLRTFNLRNPYINIIIENKVAFHYLKIGLLIKTGILSVFTIFYLEKNVYMFPIYFYWLIIPPTVFFTYYLNNFWGQNKEIYLLVHLSPFKRSKIFFKYILFSFILIAVDMPISLFFMLLNSKISAINIIFYSASSLSLILAGYITSLFFIRPIDKSNRVQLKNENISVGGNMLSLALISIAFFAKMNIKLEVIYIMLLIAAFILFFMKNNSLFNKSITKNAYNLHIFK